MGETMITKTLDAAIDDVNVGKREVVAVISTDAIDRDNEVVQPKGLRDKVKAGKAVVMVNHDYQTLPVGKALWVKAEDHRVIAKYRVSDQTQMARDVFGLLQDGTLNTHSIGFVSHRASAPSTQEKNLRPDLERAKLVHRDWSLLEFSVVGIPANPEALTLAVSKGIASAEMLKFFGVKEPKEGAAATVIETSIDEDAIKRAFYETLLKRFHVGK